MVIPALAQLERVLTKPDTSDSDRIKAALAILNRTGYPDRHSVDLGLREPSKFDELTDTAFVIMRGRGNITDGDEPGALPPGDGGVEDETLNDLLDQRERNRQRAASTRMSHDGHEVVEGRIVAEPEPDADLFGYPKSRERRYRDSGTTEHDPDGTRPAEPDWAAYEKRLREGLE